MGTFGMSYNCIYEAKNVTSLLLQYAMGTRVITRNSNISIQQPRFADNVRVQCNVVSFALLRRQKCNFDDTKISSFSWKLH